MAGETPPRRRGRPRLPVAEHRTHGVYVRLSEAELALLDARRQAVAMRRSQYLRTAALATLPPHVPEINREAQRQLAGLGANINQIARRAHELARRAHQDEGGEQDEDEGDTAELPGLEAALDALVDLSRRLTDGTPAPRPPQSQDPSS